jgi:iron(III) transport system substrate-binding protein
MITINRKLGIVITIILLGSLITPPGALAQTTPSTDYKTIINGSKQEKGLTVYSVMGSDNWAPLLKAFKAKYPWIKVQTDDLDAVEVVDRYLSEVSDGLPTADLLVTTAEDAWGDVDAAGEILPYTSIEDAHLPDWAKLTPNIYTVSSDPMVLIWNKKAVPNPPNSLQALADMIKADPAAYAGKLNTYDARKNETGLESFWFWTEKMGEDGWTILDTLGSTQIVPETSASDMVDSVLSGETNIGFFVSAISVLPRLAKAPDLGWSMIADGTPVINREMAITKHGTSPNSAKLLLDFILSADGQIAFSQGGLTAYRDDIVDKAKTHLDTLEQSVGADNMIYFEIEPRLSDPDIQAQFLERWQQAFNLPSNSGN